MKKGCIHLVMLRYAMQKYTAKLNLNPRKQYDLIEREESEIVLWSSSRHQRGGGEIYKRYMSGYGVVPFMIIIMVLHAA